MKISQLVAAFQKYSESQNRKTEATTDSPAPVPAKAPAAADTSLQSASTDDIVTVSPQAVFLFTASQYDPRSISRRDVGDMADTLLDGGAISQRDHAILTSAPDSQNGSSGAVTNFGSSGDLIAHFQGRLSGHMAQSNVDAVESDTRALSILGRLASIRDELL